MIEFNFTDYNSIYIDKTNFIVYSLLYEKDRTMHGTNPRKTLK